MSVDNFKNFAKVQVSLGYDASATSIVLSTGGGAKLPTAPFNVVWYNSTDYPDPSDDPNVEIVRVTAIVGDTLTVTRAQESTAASTKNSTGKTYKMLAALTAKTINTDLPTNIFSDTVAGSIDGSNRVFTVANNIGIAISLFLAGIPYQPGVDFTVTGAKQLTMTVAPDPSLSGQPFWLSHT